MTPWPRPPGPSSSTTTGRLPITATRYQLEEVKRTSIERAVVRMVVTPAKIISVQALYRMRSAQQRLAVQLPEGAAFDTQPLRINGRPVTLEKGQQNEYFVPLAAANADTPFVLELRYTLQGDGSRLDLPGFPARAGRGQGVPVRVSARDADACWACAGHGARSFSWQVRSRDARRPWPRCRRRPAGAWVREGVDCPAVRPRSSRPTGSSTSIRRCARPPAPEGSLAMTTIDQHWLNGLVFAVTVLLGVLLLPARLPVRTLGRRRGDRRAWCWRACSCRPSRCRFSMACWLAAIFIVAVMWSVAWVMRWRGSGNASCATGSAGRERRVQPRAGRWLPPKPQAAEGGPTNA